MKKDFNQEVLKNFNALAEDIKVLKVGSPAPKFTLKDQNSKSHKLYDYKGKKVVLYFYPKDDTPGCTIEAKDFRDNYVEFKKKKIAVFGISPDNEEKHKKFCTKYELSFTLLADIDHKISEKYGVWIQKSMYGRKYMGIQRATFIINEKGRIIKIFPKVKPLGHAKEVLEFLS